MPNGFTMFPSRISHVVLPVILRVLLSQLEHVLVTMGLGEDAGGSNVLVFSVTFHYASVRKRCLGLGDGGWWKVRLESVAVNDYGFGAKSELVKCTMHGEERGSKDVDAINFFGCDDAYCPSKGIVLNLLAEFVALLGG